MAVGIYVQQFSTVVDTLHVHFHIGYCDIHSHASSTKAEASPTLQRSVELGFKDGVLVAGPHTGLAQAIQYALFAH